MPAHTLHHLPLTTLRPHPRNANRMPSEMMTKLRAHIARTGNYEPLIVRIHPDDPTTYQLINGHHRAQILRDLNHHTAACLIWDLTDAQTNLLLATINRLEGSDNPTRRLALLETLAQDSAVDDLALLLPEDAATLSKLLASALPPEIAPPPDISSMPEAFTVFLPAGQKAALLKVLHLHNPDPACALLQLAGLAANASDVVV